MTNIKITVSDDDMPDSYGYYSIKTEDASVTGQITPSRRGDVVKLLQEALSIDDGKIQVDTYPDITVPTIVPNTEDETNDEDAFYDKNKIYDEEENLDDEDDEEHYDDEDDEDYNYDDEDVYVPEPAHVYLTLGALKHGLLNDIKRPYKNHEIVFNYVEANNAPKALHVTLDDGSDNDDYRFMIVTSSGVKRPIMFDGLKPLDEEPVNDSSDPVVAKIYFNEDDLSKYDLQDWDVASND